MTIADAAKGIAIIAAAVVVIDVMAKPFISI
jgi:hypothetical protein